AAIAPVIAVERRVVERHREEERRDEEREDRDREAREADRKRAMDDGALRSTRRGVAVVHAREGQGIPIVWAGPGCASSAPAGRVVKRSASSTRTQRTNRRAASSARPLSPAANPSPRSRMAGRLPRPPTAKIESVRARPA